MIGNQDLAWGPPAGAMSSPRYPLLIWSSAQVSGTHAQKHCPGGGLVLEKPVRAVELECPVIFSVENQFLFFSHTIVIKMVLEFPV